MSSISGVYAIGGRWAINTLAQDDAKPLRISPLPLRHSENMAHVLPDLPYPYNALEPYISQQIMELHHKKHHQTYVNSLNAAEQAYAKAATPKERIALQSALRFNGGGE